MKNNKIEKKPVLQDYLDQLKQENKLELSEIIGLISEACISISDLVREAPLKNYLGKVSKINVQGEVQQKLDILADEIWMKKLSKNPYLFEMLSEEQENVKQLNHPSAQYSLAFDPLDGSSNLNINITVGSIFGIQKAKKDGLLKTGRELIISGYCLYGPSRQLVLCDGKKVSIYSYDRLNRTFYLVRENCQVPDISDEYAINASNRRFWQKPIKDFIKDCEQGEDGPLKKRYNMRWIASMAAEIHRILIRGGIFLYPIDKRYLKIGGRLRLIYECNPMAHIIETAGGISSTVQEKNQISILDVKPYQPHQRISVAMGSKLTMQKLLQYFKE